MPTMEILENGNIKITIPMSLRNCAGRKRVVSPGGELPHEQSPLLLNIARAFRWQELIDKGEYTNVQELANALGMDCSNVSRTIRLAYLSPKLIHMAIVGTLPERLGSGAMRGTLPDLWDEQARELNCPDAAYNAQ